MIYVEINMLIVKLGGKNICWIAEFPFYTEWLNIFTFSDTSYQSAFI